MTEVKTIWPWQKGKFHAKRSGAPKKERKRSLEEIIGENWLQKIGVVMVLLGIIFFLKYSFDQCWISPAMQVGIGVFIGLLFIGG